MKRASTVILLTALAACETEVPPGVVLWDSAGVEMVRHTSNAESVQELMLDSLPVLSIGDTEGPRSLYRVSAAAQLGDGSVLIANAGTSELRRYGPAGDLIAAFGRRGEGPGEFRSFAPVLTILEGDTALVFDSRLRRITALSPDGHARSITPVVPTTTSTIQYAGSWSMSAHLIAHTVQRADRSAEGIRIDSAEVAVHDGDGAETVRAPRHYQRQWVSIARPGGVVQVMEQPLGRQTEILKVAQSMVMLDNLSEELRIYTTNGALERVVRRLSQRRRVTHDERSEFPSSQFPGVVLPDSFPSFRRAMAGTDSLIWVERFPPASDAATVLWEGFDTHGVTRARVRVPGDLRVLQIGRERMVAVARDSLGVERVKLFQVVESS